MADSFETGQPWQVHKRNTIRSVSCQQLGKNCMGLAVCLCMHVVGLTVVHNPPVIVAKGCVDTFLASMISPRLAWVA